MDIEDIGAYWLEDIPWTHEWCERNFSTIKVLSNDRKFVNIIEYCKDCGSTNVKISKAWKKYCGEICWKKQD